MTIPTRRFMARLTGLLGGFIVLSASAATANPWYFAADPAQQFDGLVTDPGLIVELDTTADAFSEFINLASPPVEIDAFERVDDQTLYFSTNMHDTIVSQVSNPGDVFLYDGSEGTFTKVLDAAAAGLPDGVDVDAVTLAENGDLVVSIDTHAVLDGTRFEDADLIRYDGAAFSMFASAQTLGLDAAADIDGVSRFSNDRLVLSTRTGGIAAGIAYRHNDLLYAELGEAIKRIELNFSDETGTSADLIAISGAELPDSIFHDRFEP